MTIERPVDAPTATGGGAGHTAVEALRRCVKAVNAASPASVERFVRAWFTDANAAREPMSARVQLFMEWRRRGPLEILSLENPHDGAAEALIEFVFTGERFWIVVETRGEDGGRIERLLAGRAPAPTDGAVHDDAADADAILAYARRLAERDVFSGQILVARRGQVLAEGAMGLANRDYGVANTLSTRFNVASIVKMWTGVAAARLAERRLVSYDDRVSDYFPFPDGETAKRITLAHLLSHTAGLGNYFNEGTERTARHLIRTVDDYLERSDRGALKFAPGTCWDYSNTGMVLAGKVLEIATGKPFAAILDDEIFKPAAMESASFLFLDHANADVAVGYTRRYAASGAMHYENNLFTNFVGGCPAGGAYATVRDLHRFANALHDGTLVSAQTAELLTTAKPDLGAPFYGFGFAIHTDRALYGHSGGMLGCSANLDMVREPEGWTIAILANDLGMRALALKARELIGVTVPEAQEARGYLPHPGLSAR